MWGEQKRLRIEPDDWHQKLSNLRRAFGALTGQGVSGCQGLEIRNLEMTLWWSLSLELP